MVKGNSGLKKMVQAGTGAVNRSTMDALAHLSPPGRNTEYLSHADIEPDPNQPRTEFRPIDGVVSPVALANLRNLADNILDIGLQQPITVRPHPEKDGKFIINWGERRWRAFGLLIEDGHADFEKIEAFIDDADSAAWRLRLGQLAENIQRDDLSDLEVATFLRRFLEEFKELQQSDLCVVTRKSKQWVSRMLGLLDPRYADLVDAGHISYAAILEQFKALPQHRQEALAAEAKATGKKITSGAIKRQQQAAKEAGERKSREDAAERQSGKMSAEAKINPAVAGTLAVAVARQEVRIKGMQAATLFEVLKGHDFQVSLSLTTSDIRAAIERLGGTVPDSDLMLTNALYDCLSLRH